MGTPKEACIGAGSRGSGVQVLRARPGGAGLQVATPPCPLWLPAPGQAGGGMGGTIGACNPGMTRVGPLNQCFSNCTVGRTHLRSGDSESVGLG